MRITVYSDESLGWYEVLLKAIKGRDSSFLVQDIRVWCIDTSFHPTLVEMITLDLNYQEIGSWTDDGMFGR